MNKANLLGLCHISAILQNYAYFVDVDDAATDAKFIAVADADAAVCIRQR